MYVTAEYVSENRHTKKGLLLLILSLAVIVSMSAIALNCADDSDAGTVFNVNGLNYETTSDTEVSVYRTECSGAVTIPSKVTYEGTEYSVTALRYHAFATCWYMTSVTIPDSVTSIGNNAFDCCTSLTSITIPDSVTFIGGHAFSECRSLKTIKLSENITVINAYTFNKCTSLTTVNIPNSVTAIGSYAFNECSSLTSIKIPSGITVINSYSFYGCSAMKTADIPDSVIRFEGYAFSGCSSIESIYIPEGTTSIAGYAFNECRSLTSATIPKSVTTIGDNAFCRCSSITAFNVSDENINYYSIDGVLFSKTTDTLLQYPGSKSDTVYRMPDSSTTIYPYSFVDCKYLESIVISNSITTIGEYALYGCRSMTTLTIPNSVTTIGPAAFGECTSLTSVEIPNSVTTLRYSAFTKCTSLRTVVLPDSITSISGRIFEGCTSLVSVNIPDSITLIDFAAFEGCTSLKSITIPNSVRTIGIRAFSGCSGLESITIPNSVTSIGHTAFFSCKSLKSIALPSGIACIDDWTFGFCYSLKSITIPDGVYRIGYAAFKECKALETVIIPNRTTVICDYAFNWCTSLKSIVIPSSVVAVGSWAFERCRFYDFDGTTELSKTANELSGYAYAGDSCTKLIRHNISTITLDDCSGKVIRKWNYVEGTSVPNIDLTVNKEQDVQYTYRQTGWMYENGDAATFPLTATGDIILYPMYEATLRSYTVTFTVNSEEYSTFTGKYGDTIQLPDAPVKEPTVSTTYAFSAWSPVPDKVIGEQTFAAIFTEYAREYTVTYVISGMTVTSVSHDNGSVVNVDECTITGYDISGWDSKDVTVTDNEFMMPLQDVTVTGISSIKTFDITFWDDGTVFHTYTADYGSEVIVPNDRPVKEATQEYAYEFVCWAYEDGDIFVTMTVTDDIDIYAVFGHEYRSYHIAFISQDKEYAGYELFYGMDFTIPSEDPVKDPDVNFTYSFKEWNTKENGTGVPVIGGNVTGDVTLYAIFDDNIREFDVSYTYGDTVLFTDNYAYGAHVTLRDPYEVTGHTTSWYVPVTVTENGFDMPGYDISATLIAEPIVYDLIFYDEDGTTVLHSYALKYGTDMPMIKDPSKEPTEKDTAVFAGWVTYDGESLVLPDKVTSDITVYASYTVNPRSYHVIFYSCEGTVLSSALTEYGTAIVPIEAPEKESDGMFAYTFAGWEGYKEGMKVLKRTVLTATYIKTPIIPDDKKDIVLEAEDDQYVRFTDDVISELKEKAKTEDVSLTIKVSEGVVKFDKGAVMSFEGGSDLSVTKLDSDSMAESVKEIVGDAPVYEFYFGTNKQFGEGTATVTVPYELKENDDPNDLVIYYISDGRIAQRIECTYSDGYVTFITNHFSTYAIVTEPSEEDGIGIGLMIGIIAAVIAEAAIIGIILRWKNGSERQ